MEVTKERILDGEIRKDAVVDETILSCICTMSMLSKLHFFKFLPCKCLDLNFNIDRNT